MVTTKTDSVREDREDVVARDQMEMSRNPRMETKLLQDKAAEVVTTATGDRTTELVVQERMLVREEVEETNKDQAVDRLVEMALAGDPIGTTMVAVAKVLA